RSGWGGSLPAERCRPLGNARQYAAGNVLEGGAARFFQWRRGVGKRHVLAIGIGERAIKREVAAQPGVGVKFHTADTDLLCISQVATVYREVGRLYLCLVVVYIGMVRSEAK